MLLSHQSRSAEQRPLTTQSARAAAKLFVVLLLPRRPGPRKAKATSKTAQDKDDSAALSFNDDLKAKLAEHNRGLMKGRCTYEPSKGRVKDWKKVPTSEVFFFILFYAPPYSRKGRAAAEALVLLSERSVLGREAGQASPASKPGTVRWHLSATEGLFVD